MSKLHEAGSSVAHLAKQYAAVIELGKFFETIGSLENLEAETQARLVKLNEELNDANTILVGVRKRSEELVLDNISVMEKAQYEAHEIVATAQTLAHNTVDAATARANKLDADVQALEQATRDKFADREAVISGLDAEIALRREKLAATETAIKQARENFLGGVDALKT